MRRRELLLLALGAAGCRAATSASRREGGARGQCAPGPEGEGLLRLRTADVVVELADASLRRTERELFAWVRASAGAVESFYGRSPFPRVHVRVHAAAGRSVRYGTASVAGGAAVDVWVGEGASPRGLRRDWILVHEFVHFAFPLVGPRHRWAEEGLASYVEPLARCAFGTLAPEAVWRELVRGLPRGQPRRGEGGLDGTASWARTYWGGALFCFLADVEIRRRTEGACGLPDALRGIVAAGGRMDRRWSLREAFAVADRATGETVLADLYAELGPRPVRHDLDGLFASLGVRRGRRGAWLDDEAPEAWIRRGIAGTRAG